MLLDLRQADAGLEVLRGHFEQVPGLRLNKVEAHSMLSSAERRSYLVQRVEGSLRLAEQSLEAEHVLLNLCGRLLRLERGDRLELREADSPFHDHGRSD